MNDAKVTALLGVIGSGKDYRAQELVKAGAVQINFKDALLDMASDLVGYDVRADYDWFKVAPVGVLRPKEGYQKYYTSLDAGDAIARLPGVMTGRVMLQRLGTDVMRKRDADYWVRRWATSAATALSKGQPMVVADCRFLNEVKAVQSFPGHKFIFCDYRSLRYNATSAHESERLAQTLLAMGLKDGDRITREHVEEADRRMNV